MKTYNINLNKIIKRAIAMPLYFLYFLSFLFPRSKRIWVFGNPKEKGFSGNPKYFFLYVLKNKKDKIKPIWISERKDIVKELKQKGLNVYYKISLKGAYYALRAEYFIFDGSSSEINFWLSGGAKKIMLWHDIPLKKIGGDAKTGKYAYFHHLKGLKRFIYRLLVPWVFEKKDLIITTSSFFQELFMRLHSLDNQKVVITGFPRNDIFFKQFEYPDLDLNISIVRKIKEFKNEKKDGKVIFYLPTFRDTGNDPLTEAGFNFDKLREFLIKNNSIFIAKPHIWTNTNKKFFQKFNSKEIIILPNEVDVYPALSLADILITDYSSVYSDFLLLDKPIIFFPYDYQKYTKRDRELYFDYEEFTAGPKVYNFEQLLECLESCVKGEDEFKEKRKKIREFFFKYIDGNSSERIFQIIEEKL